MLRLHGNPYATFFRRVQIALLEKDLPHELVILDLAAGDHRKPEYLKLNPYGRVPALEHDGFMLYESGAILQYLEAIHPSPPLVPADARGRAVVDMHVRLCDQQMSRQTTTIIFPKRFQPPERWNREEMARAKAEIEQHLAILERELGDAEYLVGGRYSLAEVAYAPFLEFLPLMEIVPPPGIAAWRDLLLARPSSIATRPAK